MIITNAFRNPELSLLVKLKTIFILSSLPIISNPCHCQKPPLLPHTHRSPPDLLPISSFPLFKYPKASKTLFFPSQTVMGASESVPQKSIHEFTVKVLLYPLYFFHNSSFFWLGFMLLFCCLCCRTAKARTWTLASTKEKFSLWLMLLLNGPFLPFLSSLLWIRLLCFSFPDSKLFTFMILNSGFTDSNYTQLTELYNKYKDKGWFLFA